MPFCVGCFSVSVLFEKKIQCTVLNNSNSNFIPLINGETETHTIGVKNYFLKDICIADNNFLSRHAGTNNETLTQKTKE